MKEISNDVIKKSLQMLNEKKEQFENEKRELEFQLQKLSEKQDDLRDKILETFGTTDKDVLETKLNELKEEAYKILSELNQIDNEDDDEL